jgi:hypothetical protein
MSWDRLASIDSPAARRDRSRRERRLELAKPTPNATVVAWLDAQVRPAITATVLAELPSHVTAT